MDEIFLTRHGHWIGDGNDSPSAYHFMLTVTPDGRHSGPPSWPDQEFWRGLGAQCIQGDVAAALLTRSSLIWRPRPTIVSMPAISRKLAFFADPFGNLVELAEVLP
jgi:hypothetical protein